MYLEKIEIHGFKSFGDAVKLSIPKGITGVIGPNGSGKSNVSDAIRWVLGEQSAKSLRGSKMEDIIFAGTEKRKSLGYAEVALSIKNEDKKAAIDFSEIVVKRRVYRSGESEYFINGSSCRLKDVQELFMDTGIGKDGYSIIGQGQIDRVLSSKPEERRTLFEEAAGIFKYKVRRQEAEKKLEKERENLVRIEDILGEIEERLEPLSIEAEKTSEYIKLKDKLKEIDLNIFIYELDRLDKELLDLTHKLELTEEELNKDQEEHQNLLVKAEKLKLKRDELYRKSEQLIEYSSQLQRDKERSENQIIVNNEKKQNIERLLKQVNEEREAAESDQQNKQDKLSLLETKCTALEIEKASKLSIIEQDEVILENFSKELEQIEGSINESKESMYESIRQADLFQAEIKQNEGSQSQLEYRHEQICEQVAQQNSEIQHQEIQIKVLEKHEAENQKITTDMSDEILKLQEEKIDLLKQKQDAERQLNTLKQNLIQGERQLKWLQHIKEEHEGYFGSVKQVLSVAKKEATVKGIIGVVGELLEVPKEYEVAIVTALGGAIQNIVTNSEQDAKNMIQIMKQRGISRVTFLPLDTIRPSTAINEKALEQEEGFLGFANELVKFDERYNHIVSSLLGRILIVDEMNHASKIARKYNYRYKLVTLEGEVFNSGGSLSGGSTKNQSNNIFARARELRELEEHVNTMHAQVVKKEKIFEDSSLALTQAVEDYESKEVKYTLAIDQGKNIILELEKARHELKYTKQNQLQLINERNNIQESIDVLEEGREATKEKLEELNRKVEGSQKDLVSLEQSLNVQRERRSQLEREMTEKKIGLSSTLQNIEYTTEQIKELQLALGGHDEKKASIEQMIESYLHEIEQLDLQNKEIDAQIEKLQVLISERQEERKACDLDKANLEKSQKELEEKVGQLGEHIDHLKEDKYRLENKKNNSLLQKQNWGNTMWEQYEMTYSHALPFKKDNISISDLKKEAVEIKSSIKEIGNVNVNAVEEYKETKERFDFLTQQKADIEKAELMLVEMIEQLLHEMKEIFTTEFEKIANNFSEVFKELFGGGQAYLQLIDEENILESGIDIIAQPPGKKLQNMTLLSGGERTLTAISLIFGILKLKPSPFCVLDEIEAALDDANVIRFADYLERLSDETQFIVITHRKGTMERAHTLYGVTMQERGVSTILSIQLQDIKNYIDEKKSS